MNQNNPDIQKIDRMLSSPLFRIILPLLIIAMYLAGILLMIFIRFEQGLSLWVFSTVFGALLLYVKHRQEKKKQDLLQIEEDERAYQQRAKEQEQSDHANA